MLVLKKKTNQHHVGNSILNHVYDTKAHAYTQNCNVAHVWKVYLLRIFTEARF